MPEELTTAAGQTAGEAGSSANPNAEGGATATQQNAGEKTERAFTQADIDRIVKERLAAEQERQRKKAEEDEAKRKGEFEKLLQQREQELDELKATLAQREHEALKAKVAAKHHLPPALASRLQGDDEAALEADAAELAKLIPAGNSSSTANPPGSRGTGQSLAGTSTVPSWGSIFKR